MKLVNAKKIIEKAHANRYAVAHININNLEWAKTILEEAQKLNTPVILGTSEGAVKYMGGVDTIGSMVSGLIRDLKITVPVVLHLDHGTYETAVKCIESSQYTSVMFDGSHLSFEENLAKTKSIIALAKKHDVSVEAEVGTIGGEEDGVVGSGELANPKEASIMKAAGVDFLAAGIGNIHGPYPANWKSLSFETLKTLTEALKMPLVLHGGTGIPTEQIRKAISLGVAKVNINTSLQLVFAKGVREYIEANEDQKGKGYDPRKLLSFGVKEMRKQIRFHFEETGSLGKA